MVRLSFLVPLPEFKDQLIKHAFPCERKSPWRFLSVLAKCRSATCKCKGSETPNRFGSSSVEENKTINDLGSERVNYKSHFSI